jgi:hypothetical protein
MLTPDDRALALRILAEEIEHRTDFPCRIEGDAVLLGESSVGIYVDNTCLDSVPPGTIHLDTGCAFNREREDTTGSVNRLRPWSVALR